MAKTIRLGRRAFGGFLAGVAAAGVINTGCAKAAAPDGAGSVRDMLAALQAAKALSFTTETSFGASVAGDKLRTLGNRASIVFARSDGILATFGSGGEPDVQMLLAGDKVTLIRLSLAAKTTLKLAPENGAAFMVPGLFIPFLGLLADDPEVAFFGGIRSVTAIAEGLPDQPEQTSLAAVMGGQFTGEVWMDRGTGLPVRTNGTWFGANGKIAASAAVSFSGWSSQSPAAGAFSVKGITDAKSVELDDLGL